MPATAVLVDRRLRPAPLPAFARRATLPRGAPFLTIYLPPLLVALVAVLLAVTVYRQFLEVSRGLWYSPLHDRNAHLWFGISLAIDIRTADLLHFLKDLHGARIWGPLHPLLLSGILAVGGLNEQLAVLPSLTCWVLSAVFAFLAARRGVRRGGNLAGSVAALFVLASPAHRAFATDIMLESLGACLSLGALYFYQRAEQNRRPWMGACLGLMLSLLFFDKYNYWLLVILALIVATLAAYPLAYARLGLSVLRQVNVLRWLRNQRRQPLSYVLAGLLLLWAAMLACRGEPLQVGKLRISTHSSHNLLSVIYVVAFVRLWPWWRQTGRTLVQKLGVPGRQLVYWHVWPIVIWFLWPQRLGNCLAYLTRNHGQGGETHPFLGGLPFYWDCLADHYHQFAWAPYLVAGLVAVAVLTCRKLRPGASLILWFLLIAGGLTMAHPTLRSRFIHSWVATIWVAAGIGLAQLLYGRLTDSWARLRPWLAAGLLLVLSWLQFPGMLQAGRSHEGGPKPGRLVVLDVIDAYLPEVTDSRDVVIIGNRPLKFISAWTFLQKVGEHGRLETDLRGFCTAPQQDRHSFDQWLKSTSCKTLVFVEVPRGSLFHDETPFPIYDQVPAFLAEQQVFKKARTWEFPQYGGATVTLWKR